MATEEADTMERMDILSRCHGFKHCDDISGVHCASQDYAMYTHG